MAQFLLQSAVPLRGHVVFDPGRDRRRVIRRQIVFVIIRLFDEGFAHRLMIPAENACAPPCTAGMPGTSQAYRSRHCEEGGDEAISRAGLPRRTRYDAARGLAVRPHLSAG